ncbi:MAG: exodeoxyribonuclease VII small subunit [Ruminococcaceae bacterium]|nr:exodeoxyribonuclease VII small subunit [Oscillospiraceae bacterium]
MAKQEFSFEKALEELRSIVAALESANVGLDDALKYYERGVELVRLCNERLNEAHVRVDMLHLNADGTPSLQPFVEEQEV